MTIAQQLTKHLKNIILISSEDLYLFLRDRCNDADIIEAEMLTSGFLVTISIGIHTFYALASMRVEIKRDGKNPVSMGF